MITTEIVELLQAGEEAHAKLFMARIDQIDENYGGNKYYKLKYNLEFALQNGFDSILTFGGAFSNHIAATAAIGKKFGIKTIGFIRGEELENKISENPTLQFAMKQGMDLHFISRSEYKMKETDVVLEDIRTKFPNAYIIPEGGTNELAIKGCLEIISSLKQEFDFICVPVGTGGTISGLILSASPQTKIIGFPVLKGGEFLTEGIKSLITTSNVSKENLNYELKCDYHFGGYAKCSKELLKFKKRFEVEHKIPLDYVYTSKMVYGVFDLMQKKYFLEGSKILMLHTGGLQGNIGWEKFNYSPAS